MGDEQVILKEIFGYDSFRPGHEAFCQVLF